MRFIEIDLLGVYVAPISVMLVVAWLITIGLRRVAVRFGLLRHVWHPALPGKFYRLHPHRPRDVLTQ